MAGWIFTSWYPIFSLLLMGIVFAWLGVGFVAFIRSVIYRGLL